MEIVIALISIVPTIATLIVTILNNRRMSSFAGLKQALENYQLTIDKRFLISELSEIKQGLKKEEQQKVLIHEAKDEYNSLGGDSYVDTMFDDLLRAGKL